jgi:hypothetical protein
MDNTEHHRRAIELEAVVASNAREFALSNANLVGPEMGQIFADALQRSLSSSRDTQGRSSREFAALWK